MGFVINYFIKKCVEAIAEVYSILTKSVMSVFEADLVVGVLTVAQTLGWVLLGVAILLRISIFGEQSANGNPNIYSLGKDLFLGLIFIPLNIELAKIIFIKNTELQTMAVKSISKSISDPSLVTLLDPGDHIFKQMFVVIFAIAAFMFFFGTLKRVATCVVIIICNFTSVIGIVLGNPTFFFTCLGKYTGMNISHFCQGIFFFGAVASFISVNNQGLAVISDISQLINPLVYLIFSITAPKTIDMIFSIGAGGRGGMVGGVIQSMMLLRMSRGG